MRELADSGEEVEIAGVCPTDSHLIQYDIPILDCRNLII